MKNLLRHIIAIVCLAALVCSGQLSACACEIAPDHSCASHTADTTHNHQHDGCGDHSSDDDHSHGPCSCSCASCHACNHMPVTLTTALLPRLQPLFLSNFIDNSSRIPQPAAEIFIPPKLA